MVPIAQNWRVPAEFEPHECTWLMWPFRPDNWRDQAYHAQHDMLSLAAIVAQFEPVKLAVLPTEFERVRRMVGPNIKPVPMHYDDVWVRDTGPTILTSPDGQILAIDWVFNSWGGLFSTSNADNRVATLISEYHLCPVLSAPLTLEGGAILSDGAGTLITTEEAVLANNRNPGLSKSDAEKVFRDFLNIRKVIWIPEGLSNDEAGGHVDNVCSFAPNNTIIVASTSDANHPDYERLMDVRSILASSVNAAGSPYTIVEVPMPAMKPITPTEASGFSDPDGEIVRQAGAPLAPSYLNFLPVNGAVIVPTFGCPEDCIALEIVATCFPGRQVVPFRSREFLLGGGAIHCLTKEIPIRVC